MIPRFTAKVRSVTHILQAREFDTDATVGVPRKLADSLEFSNLSGLDPALCFTPVLNVDSLRHL